MTLLLVFLLLKERASLHQNEVQISNDQRHVLRNSSSIEDEVKITILTPSYYSQEQKGTMPQLLRHYYYYKYYYYFLRLLLNTHFLQDTT